MSEGWFLTEFIYVDEDPYILGKEETNLSSITFTTTTTTFVVLLLLVGESKLHEVHVRLGS
jgi:hypothetical protein